MCSVVVLGDWLSDCCLRNALLWVWVTLIRSFWHRTLAGCSLPSGTRRVVSSILAILAPSHDIFIATIYRGISWLWRYWYRHVSTKSIEVSRVLHNTICDCMLVFALPVNIVSIVCSDIIHSSCNKYWLTPIYFLLVKFIHSSFALSKNYDSLDKFIGNLEYF